MEIVNIGCSTYNNCKYVTVDIERVCNCRDYSKANILDISRRTKTPDFIINYKNAKPHTMKFSSIQKFQNNSLDSIVALNKVICRVHLVTLIDASLSKLKIGGTLVFDMNNTFCSVYQGQAFYKRHFVLSPFAGYMYSIDYVISTLIDYNRSLSIDEMVAINHANLEVSPEGNAQERYLVKVRRIA